MTGTRVAAGFHAVLSSLRADPAAVTEIYLDSARDDARARDVVAAADKAGVRLLRVPAQRLDGLHGGRHQGVIAHVRLGTRFNSLDDLLDGLTEPPLLLVLDGITDPHNLGACLRVADATVSKVASGAAEVVPYFMVTNLARTLTELKERDIWIIGTDERGEHGLYEAEWPLASAWVFGAEGEGMRRLTREHCDLLVRIPMSGSVASLNVSVASGVCLFEARRRRGSSKAEKRVSP